MRCTCLRQFSKASIFGQRLASESIGTKGLLKGRMVQFEDTELTTRQSNEANPVTIAMKINETRWTQGREGVTERDIVTDVTLVTHSEFA
jgi:hypothetical protein